MYRQPRYMQDGNRIDVDSAVIELGAGDVRHRMAANPETHATRQPISSLRGGLIAPISERACPLTKENVGSKLLSQDEVLAAVAALADGDPVVVLDEDHNPGSLVFAAESATTRLMAFTVRYTSGFVCVALPGDQCDRLGLPPMSHCSGDDLAYRVAVDARDNGTGISAAARARTAVALSDPASAPLDFVRPGHVLPVEARPGGVLERAGHAEAAVDLVELAGRRRAAVLCTVMSDRISGETADRAELLDFARHHGLQVVSIAALTAYRRRTDPQVQCIGSQAVTTADSHVHVLAFRSLHGDGSHLALMAGAIHPGVPVYVHTECLSGDVVGLETCACRSDLQSHLTTFTKSGDGIVVYIRHVGEPWTCHRFREMSRQDRGTVDEVAAEILSELSVTSLELLNDDDDLRHTLRSFGIDAT